MEKYADNRKLQTKVLRFLCPSSVLLGPVGFSFKKPLTNFLNASLLDPPVCLNVLRNIADSVCFACFGVIKVFFWSNQSTSRTSLFRFEAQRENVNNFRCREKFLRSELLAFRCRCVRNRRRLKSHFAAFFDSNFGQKFRLINYFALSGKGDEQVDVLWNVSCTCFYRRCAAALHYF